MGSAQSNEQNRNSLGLVKPALPKALTKSLAHAGDMPTFTSEQLSNLRMEVVQPAKLLMEMKWDVEGFKLVNLLEFQQFFSAAGATDCGFDFMGLNLCGTSFMHPWLQLSGLWAYLMGCSRWAVFNVVNPG